jgi:hypothetical protein
LLFPIKFKFEMTIFPPKPTALGLAGGIRVDTSDGEPALSAYTQVYPLLLVVLRSLPLSHPNLLQLFINANDPKKSSFYLKMGRFDLYNLLSIFFDPQDLAKISSPIPLFRFFLPLLRELFDIT